MPQRILAGAAIGALAITALTPAVASAAPAAPSGTHASSTARAALGHGAISLQLKDSRRRYSGLATSLNWAGYAQPGRARSVHSVSTSFRVPKLSRQPTGYASTWVGIDGYSNGYLTQVGVAEEMVHGRASYYGWWETITPTSLLPEQRFALRIRPGQLITATVTVRNGRTRLTLWNRTTGRRVSHVRSYAGPGSSAEWIQEDVYVSGRVSRAPRWAKVAFTASTKNGKNPHFKYRQSMDIVDHKGVRETKTLRPNLRANAFTTVWLKAGHPSPLI